MKNHLPVLSKDIDEPCRDGGLEPCRLAGREFGLEPALEPPGVNPVLVLVYETFLGVYLPMPVPVKLLSLSLSESGVEADKDDLDGLDMATDRTERSLTYRKIH